LANRCAFMFGNLHRAERVERKARDESGPCSACNLLVVFVTWQRKASTALLSRSPWAVLLGESCFSFGLGDLTTGTKASEDSASTSGESGKSSWTISLYIPYEASL
jgi:hypothetical protein